MARTTPEPPRVPGIRGRTWATGILAWLLLVAGAPITPLAKGGCVGASLVFVAVILAIVFYIRLLRDTRGGRVGWRALGWFVLPVGLFLILCCAIGPSTMFGNDVTQAAATRFRVEDPDVPDAVMLRSTYWQLHPLFGHLKWWVGAALLMPAGVRLIGERRPGWLAAVFILSAGTGPLILRIALKLLEAGFREAPTS